MNGFWIIILMAFLATNSLDKTESVKLELKTFDEIFGKGWWDKGEAAEDLKTPAPTNFGQNALHQIDRQNTQIEQIEPNSTDQLGQIEPNSTDQNPPLTESDHYDNANLIENNAGYERKHKTVAKELGLNFTTIYNWKRKLGQTTPNNYPHTHKSDELSKFMEEQQMNRCEPEVEKDIRQCLEPMLAYANAIQLEDELVNPPDKLNMAAFHHYANHRQHFSLQGGAVFRHLCTLYANFKACTESSFKCFSLSMRAVEASYGYMCGSGHAAFERHANCFAEVENREQYVQCKRTASRAMDHATAELGGKSGVDGEQYLDVLCNAMDEYLHCCKPFVLEVCGLDAWQLVAKITRESLRVSLPTCNLEQALQQSEMRPN
uniref:Uncharacterized protein n=1 Tax=Globodera rostochiensis TaxID=31243 RepID=A0A914HPN5_GLORO